jgi:hypothetical protein
MVCVVGTVAAYSVKSSILASAAFFCTDAMLLGGSLGLVRFADRNDFAVETHSRSFDLAYQIEAGRRPD